MQGARGRFACTDCSAVFVRKEHRDRHVLAHAGVKAFRCHLCPKAFSRADTLSRHVSSHGDSLANGNLDNAQTPRRCVQACLGCAHRKQRCDGARPCQRCDQKRQPCRYPQSNSPSAESPAPSGPLDGWSSSIPDLDLLTSATDPMGVADHGIGWPAPMATSVDWFDFIDFPYPFDSTSSSTGITTATAVLNDSQLAVPHASTTPAPGAANDVSIQHNGTPAVDFPYCGPDTLDEAEAEVFGHTLGISESAYDMLHHFHRAQGVAASTSFPPIRLFDIFVDLFFEYFDPQFPCIHPMRLEAQDDQPPSWRLLLMIALIGSEYSDIDNINKYRTALRELVKRALESDTMLAALDFDTSDVQAVFLHHVYLVFSGSLKDKTLLQYRRNMLVTMCRQLRTKRRPLSDMGLRTLHPQEERWLTWLDQEERVRLICCVHVLESLGLIFNDLPLLFSLTELVQRVPSPGKVWQCRDAYTWETETSSPSTTTQDPFLNKLSLLQLYIDERCLQNHIETSRLVRTHFSSYLGLGNNNSTTDHHRASTSSATSDEQEPPATPLPANIIQGHNPQLDILMDKLAFDGTSLWSSSPTTHSVVSDIRVTAAMKSEDTLPHILFIVRQVPLRTLHAATGYQADTDQMKRAKESLHVFFTKGDGKEARRCMWHAARVFALLRRGSGDRDRRWMCYDILSLCVAVCYLLCFCESMDRDTYGSSYHGGGGEEGGRDRCGNDIEKDDSSSSTPARPRMTGNETGAEENVDSPRTRGDHGRSRTQQQQQQEQRQPIQRRRQPSIIRLDQLSDRAGIQAYIDGHSTTSSRGGDVTGQTTLLHLTGVGILNTPGMPRRLITDVIHTYETQIAWQGLCWAFSMAYKQMRRGQKPTPQAADEEA